MTTPNFLVVGAGRSGTTALAEGLRTHPEVFITNPKEPHYFALHGTTPAFRGPGDDATINRVSVTSRRAYQALYPDSHSFTALGDASVSTLYYHERAIPEIYAMNPEMRIVIMLRDPVARANSAFDYMSTRGFEPLGDVLEAVADEDRRVAANWHHLWHYTRMSRYADSVSAFQQAFGREHVQVWFYDQLARDYVGTVREVLRFIGTAPSEGEAAGVPIVNASGTPKSAALQTLIHAATRVEPLRKSVKSVTSYRAREAVRRTLLRRNELRAEVRTSLQPLFREDLSGLKALIAPEHGPGWLREGV
jgi:hypothetical protein